MNTASPPPSVGRWMSSSTGSAGTTFWSTCSAGSSVSATASHWRRTSLWKVRALVAGPRKMPQVATWGLSFPSQHAPSQAAAACGGDIGRRRGKRGRTAQLVLLWDRISRILEVHKFYKPRGLCSPTELSELAFQYRKFQGPAFWARERQSRVERNNPNFKEGDLIELTTSMLCWTFPKPLFQVRHIFWFFYNVEVGMYQESDSTEALYFLLRQQDSTLNFHTGFTLYWREELCFHISKQTWNLHVSG